MQICDCSLGYGNTGLPTCIELFKVTKRIILVPTYQSDGVTRNKIASGDTLNASYFSVLVNQSDESKRWYPLPVLDNVEQERADPLTFETSDGKSIPIEEGVRTFTCQILEAPAEYKKKLDQWGCQSVSYYAIDKQGNLMGSSDGTDLYPIEIDEKTFFSRFVYATDGTLQSLQLSFTVSDIENDGDLKMISKSETGTNLLKLDGILDVNASSASESTTGFVLTQTLDYGTYPTPLPVTGWAKDDYTLYNETAAASIVITSVTESTTLSGVYTFVYPAVTPGDILTLTASKSGFDFPSTTITTP